MPEFVLDVAVVSVVGTFEREVLNVKASGVPGIKYEFLCRFTRNIVRNLGGSSKFNFLKLGMTGNVLNIFKSI